MGTTRALIGQNPVGCAGELTEIKLPQLSQLYFAARDVKAAILFPKQRNGSHVGPLILQELNAILMLTFSFVLVEKRAH